MLEVETGDILGPLGQRVDTKLRCDIGQHSSDSLAYHCALSPSHAYCRQHAHPSVLSQGMRMCSQATSEDKGVSE